MNSIMILFPYCRNGVWMFDDENFKLKGEAFVSGMSEMIDTLIKKFNIKYEKSFLSSFLKKKIKLTFSSIPFPNYQVKIEWINYWINLKVEEKDRVGNWYYWREEKMIGWLCPALFHYFKEAPKNIYVRIENF